MADTATRVVRRPRETEAKLDRPARLNRRSGGVLAGAAVAILPIIHTARDGPVETWPA